MQLMANFLAYLFVFVAFLIFVVGTIPIILIHFTKECVLVADEFLVRRLKLLKKLVFRAHQDNS